MNNFIQKTVAKYANDNAKFLFITAAAGWFLASAAQTFGIAVNNKIDKDEKKFLIPQEICDGAANIGLYALVTAPLIKTTDKLVESGKISFKNIQKNTPEFDKLRGGARVLASLAGAVLSSSILTPLIRNKIGSMAKGEDIKQKTPIYNNYTPYYQPFFQKSYNKIPTRMNNYLAFTKNSNMKI